MTSERLRAIAHRAAVVAAVLASIATSQARWHVGATLPPTKPAGNTAMLVSVEASQEPSVTVARAGVTRTIGAYPEGTPLPWTGRAEYLVPPGATLDAVSIQGTCGGGMCSKCVPPPAAFARVLGAEIVEPWRVSDTSGVVKATLDTTQPSRSFEVVIESTRRPEVEALAIDPPDVAAQLAKPYIWEIGTAPAGSVPIKRTFSIMLSLPGASPPITFGWQVRATIHGHCRAATPCVAPASESVRVGEVKAR